MEKSNSKPKPGKLDALFEKRAVQVVVGLFSLGAAYVFASLAIDSGSLLDYAITFLWLLMGVRELVFAIRRQRSA